MKLGEIVVHIGNYNFTKFHRNQVKNKKVLLIAHFSVQNFKVSVELWKSYIVGGVIKNHEKSSDIICEQPLCVTDFVNNDARNLHCARNTHCARKIILLKLKIRTLCKESTLCKTFCQKNKTTLYQGLHCAKPPCARTYCIVQYSNSLQLAHSADLHSAVFGLVWFYKESKKICTVRIWNLD